MSKYKNAPTHDGDCVADIARSIVDKMSPSELDIYVYNELCAKLEENPKLIPEYKKIWKIDEQE